MRDKETNDAFSRCHPVLNFFYFGVVLVFTMFNQHPVFLGISYIAALSYSFILNGVKKTMKQSFLFTLPGLLIVALLNPMFNHYGVTMLYYIESSGNWVTLEALVYGVVLGAVMFVVIQWFSCYNQIMTSDKFVYLSYRLFHWCFPWHSGLCRDLWFSLRSSETDRNLWDVIPVTEILSAEPDMD